MINLTNLPLEIIPSIVEFLSFRDLLHLKQVCKRLHWILSECPVVNCLVIARSKSSQPSYRKWFDTYDPVSCQFLVTPCNFKLIDSNRKLFAALKRLFVYEQEMSAPQVNYFQELEQLEFEEATLIADQSNGQNILSLPNLHTLKLAYYGVFDGLAIDTPSLRNLASNSFNFTLQYPASVLTCHLKFYDVALKSLVNLTHLYCEHIRDAYPDLITSLPNLQELHIVDDSLELGKLVKQINTLKTPLSIYSNGVKIDPNYVPFLNEDWNDFSSDELFKRIHQGGCELSSVLHFVRAICYSELEKAFHPTHTLTKKFPNLDLLIIDKVKHPDELNRFLVCCTMRTNLRAIFFDQTTLEQPFFDALPDLLPLLNKLTILEKQQSLNLVFLLRFDGNLQSVAIDQELTVPLIGELMFKNKDLRKLQFKYAGYNTTIRRLTGFYLNMAGTSCEFGSLDELVTCLQTFQGRSQVVEPKLKPERIFDLVEGVYEPFYKWPTC